MQKFCTVILFVLFFSGSVICDTCVTFDFENGLQGNFSADERCGNTNMWLEGSYSSLPIQSPHSKSKHFITPTSDLSCISSFLIEVTPSGMLEVNVYMESSDPSDEVMVFVQEKINNSVDAMIGTTMLDPTASNFINGWHTLRIFTSTSKISKGFITLIGKAAPNSTVLVDSFRYISPASDTDWCPIYEDDKVVTQLITTEPKTESVAITATTLNSTTHSIATTKIQLERVTELMATTDAITETTKEIAKTETVPNYTTEFVARTDIPPELTKEQAKKETQSESTIEYISTTSMTLESTKEPVTSIEATTNSVAMSETPELTSKYLTTIETTSEYSTDFIMMTDVNLEIAENGETTLDSTTETNLIFTESESSTSPPNEIIGTTKFPDIEFDSMCFWTPVTIAIVVILLFVIVIIIACVFYKIGKKRGRQSFPARVNLPT